MSGYIIITADKLEIKKGTNIVDFINGKNPFQINLANVTYEDKKDDDFPSSCLTKISLTYNGARCYIKLAQPVGFKLRKTQQIKCNETTEKIKVAWKDYEFGKKMYIFNWFINQALYFAILKEIFQVKKLNSDNEFLHNIIETLKCDVNVDEYIKLIQEQYINNMTFSETKRGRGKKDAAKKSSEPHDIVSILHEHVCDYLFDDATTKPKEAEPYINYFGHDYADNFDHLASKTSAWNYNFVGKGNTVIKGVSIGTECIFNCYPITNGDRPRAATKLIEGKGVVRALKASDFKFTPEKNTPAFNAQFVLLPYLSCSCYASGQRTGLMLAVDQMTLQLRQNTALSPGVVLSVQEDEIPEYCDEIPADSVLDDY